MPDHETMYAAFAQATVIDDSGTRLGTVGQLFLDDQTHRPSWVTVRSGALGGAEKFVPCEGAEFHDGELRVPYAQQFIANAPDVGPDGHLNRDDEERLYAYYRIDARTAEARDQSHPMMEHVPADQRDTEGGLFNNTAGLHEPRPTGGERQSDAEGGIEAPVVPAAAAIPPEVGAEGRSVPSRQGTGTSGYPDQQGLSGQGSSKQHHMRSPEQH